MNVVGLAFLHPRGIFTRQQILPAFMGFVQHCDGLIFGDRLLVVGDCVRFLPIVCLDAFEPFLD